MTRLFANAFLVLVALALLTLTLEGFARIRYSGSDGRFGWEHPDYARAPKPYVMFGPVSVESHGGSCSGKKPPGERRLFMLGGSTVRVGNPPLPELLEARLHAQGYASLRVCNYGVVSQNSSQEVIRILKEVSDLEPDLIMMYDGGNDIMDEFFWDPRPGWPYNFLAYENNPIFDPRLESYPLLPLVGLGSAFVRHFFPNYLIQRLYGLEEKRAQAGYLSDGWRSQIARTYIANLTQGNRLARLSGARFVGILQPLLYFKKPVDELDPRGPSFHASRVRALIRSEVAATFKNRPFNFVDASDLFAEEPGPVFKDYVHVDQAANQRIATWIAAELDRRALLK